MNAPEFNLLDEPWIKVISSDCTVHEVGLRKLFENAHTYVSLAGDMPTQDVCVLRFLIAIVHCAVTPENSNGFQSEDEALSVYENVWKKGSISEHVVPYLERYRDRFWLFDDKHPFYQITASESGLEKGLVKASKLNGELSIGGNTDRIFANKCGDEINLLSYAQAARWLLHFIGFDDSSVKPKNKSTNSPGIGWVGKLGCVYAEGKNLFETILLNTVLLDEDGMPWERGMAPWERVTVNDDERVLIELPKSQIEILCVQSRKVILQRNEKKMVTGLVNMSGDFWKIENSFGEQMTLWQLKKAKKGEPEHCEPKNHDPKKFAWHEFDTLTAKSKKIFRRPGVASWISGLQSLKIIGKNYPIHFSFVGMQYDDKKSSVKDIYSDSVCFYASILDGMNSTWRDMISEQVDNVVRVAELLTQLNDNIIKASGGDVLAFYAGNVGFEFYGKINVPFRVWIETLNPEKGEDIETVSRSLKQTMYNIAEDLANQMINSAPPQSMRFKTVKDEKGKYARTPLPCAYNFFLRNLRKLLSSNNAEEKNV